MEHKPRQMFVELEDPSVRGFVIIETDEEQGYRMAEKWEDAPDYCNEWNTYWIPAEQLEERIRQGHAKTSHMLSDKQFRGILNLAGVRHQIEA